MYEFFIGKDLSVIQGCGLGGGSLINANVGLDCEPRVFEDSRWSKEFRDDIDNLTTVDKQHVNYMLKPKPFPGNLQKIDQIRKGKLQYESIIITIIITKIIY